MEIIKLKFSKSFLLKDFKNSPESGGIYFHYIQTDDGNYRIIYVGKCQSFLRRQQDHYSNYQWFKSVLFEIEKGEMNIKFIPDYDPPENYDSLKEKVIDSIYVTCGVFEPPIECEYEEVEGAITIHLCRKSETRKFLLSTKTNYLCRDTEIIFDDIDVSLYGLGNKILTPLNVKKVSV